MRSPPRAVDFPRLGNGLSTGVDAVGDGRLPRRDDGTRQTEHAKPQITDAESGPKSR
jgi:hypothetical protein